MTPLDEEMFSILAASPREMTAGEISPAVDFWAKSARCPAAVYNTFNVQRHLTSAKTHRGFRAAAMDTWRTAVAAA